MAGLLIEEHIRQSDRQQVEIGWYAGIMREVGTGEQAGWGSQVMGNGRNRGYCRSGGSGRV